MNQLAELLKPNMKERDAMSLPNDTHLGMHIVGITPAIAAAYLQRNDGNRRLNLKKVKQYERDMVGDRWKFAGDPVRFSKSGRLLDGQTRLTAIINANKKVRVVVFTGVDDDVFDVLDSGGPRGASDTLFIEKLSPWQARVAGAAAHLILNVVNGRSPYSNVKSTNQEVRDFYHANSSQFQRSIEFIEALPRLRPIITHSRGLFLHWEFCKKDVHLADAFFQGLYVGDGLKKSSAVFHLRARLLEFKVDNKPIAGRDEMFACIRAWNVERAGKACSGPRNLFPKADDAFPEIE